MSVFEVFSPGLFALEILFPLLGLFDVALHFTGADTTYSQTAEIGMDHMVDIANDLMTAHFADTYRLTQVGNASADPAGFGHVVPLPKIVVILQIGLLRLIDWRLYLCCNLTGFTEQILQTPARCSEPALCSSLT